MFIKAFAGISVLTVGGLYAFGAFDSYPRTVDGSPEQVMASVADLDIREMPGEPGTTAEAAGGIKPRFVTQRSENRIDWVVMSGAQVATRMYATFEPIDGGARTRITPYVVRGDAPDERTSSAFQSEGITMGLFMSAMDAEIAEMTTPGWGPECDELRDELLYGGATAASQAGQSDNKFAAGLGAIGAVHRMHQELIAAGCNPDNAPGSNGEFVQVTSQLEPSTSGFSDGSPDSGSFNDGLSDDWGD